MPEAENMHMQSPFQGFVLDLISPEYIMLINSYSRFPLDITEIFHPVDELPAIRKNITNPCKLLLSASSTETFESLLEVPFVIITFHKNESKFVRSISKRFKYNPICVGTGDFPDIDINNALGMFMFDEILYQRIEEYVSIDKKLGELRLNELLKKKLRKREMRQLKCLPKEHGVISPNLALLESLGCNLKEMKRLEFEGDHDVFKEAIIQSCQSVFEITSDGGQNRTSELVLYSPSMFSFLYNLNHITWNKIFRKIKHKDARKFLKNGILKNPDYSGGMINIGKAFNPYKIPVVGEILKIRQSEVALTKQAVNLLCTSKTIPSIRLPNSINFHGANLKNLESLASRQDTKGIKIFHRKFKEYTSKLKGTIGTELLEFVVNNSNSVTLCTDVPLEWIKFGDVPLMFSHEVSRIGMTPGNQLLTQSSSPYEIFASKEDIRKVLIIRSFSEDDPLKLHLEKSLDIFLNDLDNIEVELVDVYSKAELIITLNEFEGYIVIFDCHGNHGGNESHGWLKIGKDKVDTWTLSEVANIPPIIVLSACLTNAISGSHASVANGFISSGAISVLGTFLPVNSIKSAIFVGRLLARIGGFLPIWEKMGITEISWRTFMTGFFRMSYSTDILRALREDLQLISEEQYINVHTKSNERINIYNPDWFKLLIDDISVASRKAPEDIQRLIDSEMAIVETMFYCQIGRPEHLTSARPRKRLLQ